MKQYLLKMFMYVFLISTIFTIYKVNNKKILIENSIVNSIAYSSNVPESVYDNMIVYDGLSLNELGTKIDNVLNSSLDGYGKTIASLALEKDVDPLIASSIILVETGCKWNCSSLAKKCNNIGGMKGHGCGSYAKFNTLDEGINAFINNLSKNYFEKGLTTPESINTKYATNPNWHNDVNYYINLIKAS